MYFLIVLLGAIPEKSYKGIWKVKLFYLYWYVFVQVGEGEGAKYFAILGGGGGAIFLWDWPGVETDFFFCVIDG